MALSKITAFGNGVTSQFVVNFALGYISKEDIKCRVGDEKDSVGAPIYRAITFISDTIVTISGAPPGNAVPVVFQRSVPRAELVVNYDDGDTLNELNLDTSQKQSMMLAHEAIDTAEESRTLITMSLSDFKTYVDAEVAKAAGKTQIIFVEKAPYLEVIFVEKVSS